MRYCRNCLFWLLVVAVWLVGISAASAELAERQEKPSACGQWYWQAGSYLAGLPGMGSYIVPMMLPAINAAAVGYGAAPVEPDEVKIDIYSVNDFHGAWRAEGASLGAVKLAAYLRAQKALNPCGTVILGGGDMLTGTVESILLYGEPMVDIMNAIGFDAMVIGNHELDWGLKILQQRAGQARFPWLSANIAIKNSGSPLPGCQAYTILEKNGLKIGVIGLSTEQTRAHVHPRHLEGLKVTEPGTAYQAMLPKLRAQGVDIIVVLAHVGGFMDKQGVIGGELAELTPVLTGADILVTAHTHQKMAGHINGIPVVQAGYNGRYAAKTQLTFSRSQRQVTETKLEIVDLSKVKAGTNPDVEAIIADASQSIGSGAQVWAGVTAGDLSSYIYQLPAIVQQLTELAGKEAGAEVVFVKGPRHLEGIVGLINAGKLWDIYPYEEQVVTMEMTGTQIVQVIKHALDNGELEMLHYSGLQVIYDKSQPNQPRLTVKRADGSRLHLDKSYRIAANDYLAGGADGYTMFRQAHDIRGTQSVLREMIIAGIKKAGTIGFRPQ